MPQPPSSPRRGRLLRYGSAAVVLLCLAGYLVVQYATRPGGTLCTVVSGAGDGATYELTPEMAGNAATISAVGTTAGLPERAVTIALATALQESGLRNIGHGDRDSVGLFQQRPSEGWGTVEQIMDPAYSARKFYEGLRAIPGYSRLPLTVAAQRVQRSGFPQAYAKHEPVAALLAASLTGRAPASFGCTGLEVDEDRPAGSAEAVRAALQRDFGAEAADGRSKGRVLTLSPGGTMSAGTDAGDGGDGAGARRGWELAHWAVAHADALDVDRVAYRGREWHAASARWTRAEAGSAETAGEPDEVRIVLAK